MTRVSAKAVAGEGGSGPQLGLLGRFDVRANGRPIALAAGPQRVIAFVALQERPVRRGLVAGMLWPDAPEARAGASLRSALWRIQTRVPLIAARGDELLIDDRVELDLAAAAAAAQAILRSGAAELVELDHVPLALDLLPGWYDDWVLIERERWRQLRLRALERHCELLAAAGRFGEALEAGLEALATDPLRESAHRALVRVHLAEGNVREARRQYRLCETLLQQELGVAPSARMHELVGGGVA